MAVIVRNGCKKFGAASVLNNFELVVEHGTIFGLLGPSGCGKTTLLSCLIGLSRLDSGEISVFGSVPGSKGSGIPGPSLGYMPQEVALYPNLNISEIFSHFGGIYGMERAEIEERSDFLIDFLQLPDHKRLIRSLSGGELRCVSLAVSMIHKAPLLILDEPTAAIDSVLRERLWDYLHKIVENEQRTVIITTQYIPEAIYCNKIGIMRKGRIIREDCPHALLKEYGTPNLEQVFLILSKKDKNINQIKRNSSDEVLMENKNIDSNNSKPTESANGIKLNKFNKIGESGVFSKSQEKADLAFEEIMETFLGRKGNDLTITKTLVKKTILRQIRAPLNVVLLLFIPFLLIFLINSIVGTDPSNLKLGFVSPDWIQNLSGCSELFPKNNLSCVLNNENIKSLDYVCNFIQQFDEHQLTWVPMATEEEALEKVKLGQHLGYLSFPSNFSNHFGDWLAFRNFAENKTIDGATIGIKLDMSNAVHSGLIRKQIVKAYAKFLKQAVSICGGNEMVAEFPLKFKSVYPTGELGWSHYIQPASIVLIMSVLSSAPAIMFAVEKRMGYLDRDYVAGVKYRHLAAAAMVQGGMTVLLQLCGTFTFLPLVYGMTSEGPWAIVLLLVFLSSLVGVALGFLWAIGSRHEMDVIMVLLGLNICYIGASGSMWPLNGIPNWYRWICQLLPVTMPISAMRSVLHRGWGLENFGVWLGLGATLFWILAPIILAWALFYRRLK